MRLRLRSFLLTSALTFAPTLASATTISGLYVDGGAGYNLVQDQHVHANGTPNGDALPKFSVNHGTGFTGFGAVGWGFGNGLRVEAEGLYNFSHDEYTNDGSSSNTLQAFFKQTGRSFYTNVPGATPTSCSTFWSNGDPVKDMQDAWGVGNPATNGDQETTTPSNSWDYVPTDKCFVLPSTSPLYDSPAVKYNGINQPPFAYNGTNPTPGMYAPLATGNEYEPSSTGNVNNTTYQDGYKSAAMNYLKPIPIPVNHKGTDESYGGFFNVLYDFDLERLFGLRSIVTPFVGGGAGYLWQRYNRPGTNSLIPYVGAVANPMWGAITGTHGGFSWQGIAGVAFDTGISGLQITAQYRMIGQPGSFYNGSFNYGTEGGHANFDQRFNHQFIIGFRYAFHNKPVHIAPPSVSRAFAAASAAAPAPVPARSYLVFFDWNQYALTSRARQIVVEAAHATTYVHTTRINVNGYTDSSAAPGPAGQKYNYALSVKRARSVEAELIRTGVPASEIVIRGYGDTNPLVPTGPNTREPQNRRVEIILHA